jgi:GntR family transcriptional regulator / MocR family aminotransferase
MRQRSSIPILELDLQSNTATPLFKQIDQGIRQAIHTGRLKAGQVLPASRILAKEWCVSRHTVMEALEQLLAEGYLESKARSSLRVAKDVPLLSRQHEPSTTFKPSQRLQQLMLPTAQHLYPPPNSWAFAVGTPAINEFPRRLWQRLIKQHSHATPLHYQNPTGLPELQAAIAGYLQQARGFSVSPEQIIITSGSQQAIGLAAQVLLEAGDVVGIENPGYLGARLAFLHSGLRLLPIPLDNEGFDLDHLKIHAPDSKMIYISPSHQFPTGITMSLARRLAILAWAERQQTFVLEDDYDFEYRYNSKPLAALRSLDHSGRVFYMGTFSKVLFPALRLGYIVVPPSLIDAFWMVILATTRHLPLLEQCVTAAFIEEGHFAVHLRAMKNLYLERQNILLAAAQQYLPETAQLAPSQAGMHLLYTLEPHHVESQIHHQARSAGLLLEPYAPFWMGTPLEQGLLLGYAAPNQKAIEKGVQTLAGIVRGATSKPL